MSQTPLTQSHGFSWLELDAQLHPWHIPPTSHKSPGLCQRMGADDEENLLQSLQQEIHVGELENSP